KPMKSVPASRSCAPKVYPFALLPQNSIAQSALFIATSKKLKRIKPLRLKHFSPLYVTNSYQFFSANKLFVSRFLPHCFTQIAVKRLSFTPSFYVLCFSALVVHHFVNLVFLFT